MNRNEAGQAKAVTVEEYQRYMEERSRNGGPRGEEPNGLSRWLRSQARGVLETRIEEHNRAVPALSELFNHRAEGARLQNLFHRVVNGMGFEADRAALKVLATYKLGIMKPA